MNDFMNEPTDNESGKMDQQKETLGHLGLGSGRRTRKINNGRRHCIRTFSDFLPNYFLNTSEGILS